MPAKIDPLAERAQRLRFHGIVANWDRYGHQPWLEDLLTHEEEERHRRSQERRLRRARLGKFKLMADFDWNWPSEIDREQIEDLFGLTFILEAVNLILTGPNGVGKTTIAHNLAYQAILRGYTVLIVTGSQMLNDLASQESGSQLERRLRFYSAPQLLCVDEVGYLSYDSRHADLLFEVVSRRHLKKSTMVTTNRRFQEWNEVFPNATSVVALVDRLVQQSEVVRIAGESWRLKEAKEREALKNVQRKKRRSRSKDRTP